MEQQLNLQAGLLRELGKQSDVNTRVEELAKKHGASGNVVAANAVAFLERKLAELEEAEQLVQSLGYKSLSAALYGLSKQTRFDQVPDDLRLAPKHWTRKKAKGVQAVTALQAQRNLETLLPHLDKLLRGQTAEFLGEVRAEFFDPTVSFESFSKDVLTCLAKEAGHGKTYVAPEPDPEPTGPKPYTAQEEALLRARLGQPFDLAAANNEDV